MHLPLISFCRFPKTPASVSSSSQRGAAGPRSPLLSPSLAVGAPRGAVFRLLQTGERNSKVFFLPPWSQSLPPGNPVVRKRLFPLVHLCLLFCLQRTGTAEAAGAGGSDEPPLQTGRCHGALVSLRPLSTPHPPVPRVLQVGHSTCLRGG